jgi:hypothetical protein
MKASKLFKKKYNSNQKEKGTLYMKYIKTSHGDAMKKTCVRNDPFPTRGK